MSIALANPIDDLLDGTAEALDITEEMYLLAVARYRDVSSWLSDAADASDRALWHLHPQGSFLIGAMVMPMGRADFDIDLVCKRHVTKTSTTQAELKATVGEPLVGYYEARRTQSDGPTECSPGRRCWTIKYRGMHMDVLPAIPDAERPPTGILLTDRDLVEWQKSDPLAFADWFAARGEMRRMLVEKRAQVDPVPTWGPRNALQRAVQVLKRHRDQHFQGNPELAPPSILITTLAALAYSGQDSIIDAVFAAAEMMSTVSKKNGVWVVSNPVQDDENFADKWHEHPERATAFFAWVAQLQRGLQETVDAPSLTSKLRSLELQFGEEPVEKAARRQGATVRDAQRAGSLTFGAGAATLGAVGRRVPRHTFAGDDVAP
jgi:hypothetical protein